MDERLGQGTLEGNGCIREGGHGLELGDLGHYRHCFQAIEPVPDRAQQLCLWQSCCRLHSALQTAVANPYRTDPFIAIALWCFFHFCHFRGRPLREVDERLLRKARTSCTTLLLGCLQRIPTASGHCPGAAHGSPPCYLSPSRSISWTPQRL